MVCICIPRPETSHHDKGGDRQRGSSSTRWPWLGLLLLYLAAPVAAQGLAPLTGVIRQTIDEDSSPRAFSLVLQARDTDGDAIAWDITKQGAHGQAAVSGSGTNKTISYLPAPDWNGVDHFAVCISDGLGGVSTIQVAVTVEPRNDPPVNTVTPALAGLPAVGQELTAKPGIWDDIRDGGKGDFEYTYQWQVSRRLDGSAAVDVEGATEATFRLRDEDDGMYVRVVVTATDRDQEPLRASAASNFFKVGNAAPMFVQVVPAPATPPEPTVAVTEIAFTGNDSIPAAELEPLTADYVGRDVTLTELKAAAAAVTAEYRRRGMALAKAYVPAQEVTDGRVEMQVVEGKRGELTVEGNRIFSEAFVRRHLEEAMSGDVVSNRELERGLLIMNEDYTGLQVESVLQRGREPGTVDIQAKVAEDKQWRGYLGYNNFGSDSVTPNRFSIGADANSLAFDGDLLSLHGVFGDEPDELANGTLSYSFPLNHRGTQAGIRLATGSFEVGQEFADLDLQGDSTSVGLYVKHPFVKRREVRLTGEFGFYAENADFEILGETTSEDRIRTLYASLHASGTHWGGSTYAQLNLTQGLGELAGGMPSNSDMSSRPGADNSFTRLALSVARRQRLNRYAGLLFRFGGQVANNDLVASQEWQIGGVDSVRGYSPGEAAGDQGANVSLELQVRPLPNKPFEIVAFLDHAYAYRRNTLVSEPSSTDLTGAGVGLRVFYDHPRVSGSLRLDVGWPIGSVENTAGDEPVLYLSTELRF